MKLNHINLPVRDVAATRDFFAKYFGMETLFELGKNALAIMRDEGGMILNLSHFDKDKTAEIIYHKDFHVGFFLDTPEEVDATYARLTGDGFEVAPPVRRQGRYGFYLLAPGGFELEVAILEMGGRSPSRQNSAGPERDESTSTH